MRIADSTALTLTTGKAPGRPRQTGQTWVLGSAPNPVGQPQNIFVAVLSSTCTSSPRAGSYAARASASGSVASAVACDVIPQASFVLVGPTAAPLPARAGARSSMAPPHAAARLASSAAPTVYRRSSGVD